MSPAFHIQKTPMPVELWTADGDVRGVLHVAPFAKSHSGSETVLDVMMGPEGFLPITSESGVDLFSKSSILAIWYQEELRQELAAAMVERHGRVHLRGRAPFNVTLRDERPPERERLIDFLNDSGPYIVASHLGSQVLLSKVHLVRVVPVTDVREPVAAARRAPARKAKPKPKKKR